MKLGINMLCIIMLLSFHVTICIVRNKHFMHYEMNYMDVSKIFCLNLNGKKVESDSSSPFYGLLKNQRCSKLTSRDVIKHACVVTLHANIYLQSVHIKLLLLTT